MADSNRIKYEVEEHLEDFRDDWEADTSDREEMLDDLEFSAGSQWDARDKAAREALGRPCLTINRMSQFIRQVVGDLRNVKPSIKVLANGNGATEDVAEIMNGAIRNIEERSKDEQPYTSAVQNAVRCSIGHFRILTKNLPENPFAQDIFIEPIHNPMAVVWDHAARSITRSDAERVFVRDAMPVKKFRKEYPDADVIDFGEYSYGGHISYWTMPDKVIISELFEKIDGKATFALLESGAVMRLDKLPFHIRHDQLNGALVSIDGRGEFIEEIREAPIKKVIWKKITGRDVLERGEWPTPDFPIIPVIGEETHFEKTKKRAGLIRWAKDPQRLYNFWRSTQSEIMGAAPKAPYMIGSSQIEGFEEAWLKANVGVKPFLPFNDRTNPSRPSREIPPQISSGMANEIALAAEDMKATTGIYDASLGNRSNEQSGIAIRQRQSEGDVSTNFFGDNLAASMRKAGRIMLDLIPIVYDTQRLIRLAHEDSTNEQVMVNQVLIEDGLPKVYNDLTLGDYDVTVDIGPSYATKRQESLEGMAAILQGQPFAQYFLDLVAKNADWPGADQFAERAKKLLPPELQDEDEDPTPEQQAQRQQAAQLSAMQTMLQIEGAKTDLADKQAKTAKTAQEAEGVELDNVMKKLDLSALTNTLQQAVMVAVAQALAPQPVQPPASPLNGGGPII